MCERKIGKLWIAGNKTQNWVIRPYVIIIKHVSLPGKNTFATRCSSSSGKRIPMFNCTVALYAVSESLFLIIEQNDCSLSRIYEKQECIPVGCVPAARWPYAAVCFRGGVCLVQGGGGVCLVGGGLLWGGVCSRGCLVGGVCSGGGVSQHALRQTPSPLLWTEFLTHACENITLAQLRCGR